MGVDIRSDLYSLGVTLWEMLTGQAPFRGTPTEAMYQHHRVPLPVEQLGGVPQPLVVLLEVLLEKDPARRFQSPAELLKVMPMVRGAIDAGSFLMKTIGFSSPPRAMSKRSGFWRIERFARLLVSLTSR
jgi:serine/threonine protein kinase